MAQSDNFILILIYSTLQNNSNVLRNYNKYLQQFKECLPGFRACSDTEYDCIHDDFWCNGFYDCDNSADELDCGRRLDQYPKFSPASTTTRAPYSDFNFWIFNNRRYSAFLLRRAYWWKL